MTSIVEVIERARLAQQANEQSYPVQLELDMSYNIYERSQQAIEAAAELGERFPNLHKYAVVEHCEFVAETSITEMSPLEYAVIAAHRHVSAEEGYRIFGAFTGKDIRPKGV